MQVYLIVKYQVGMIKNKNMLAGYQVEDWKSLDCVTWATICMHIFEGHDIMQINIIVFQCVQARANIVGLCTRRRLMLERFIWCDSLYILWITESDSVITHLNALLCKLKKSFVLPYWWAVYLCHYGVQCICSKHYMRLSYRLHHLCKPRMVRLMSCKIWVTNKITKAKAPH